MYIMPAQEIGVVINTNKPRKIASLISLQKPAYFQVLNFIRLVQKIFNKRIGKQSQQYLKASTLKIW